MDRLPPSASVILSQIKTDRNIDNHGLAVLQCKWKSSHRHHQCRFKGLIIDFSECALRSICRFIPFNGLSFLGSNRGWHDRFSKTMVVEDDGFLLSEIEGM